MLFKDIVLTRYAIFNRMSEPKKTEQIEAVKYIQMIASTSGIDVSSWDCQSIFGDSKGINSIITDRVQINRRFFEHADNLRSNRPVQQNFANLSDAIKAEIDEISKRFLLEAAARAENQIGELIRRANEYFESANSILRDAATKRASVSLVPGRGNINLAQQIEEVSRSEHWEYIDTCEDEYGEIAVNLVSKTDVILQHRNLAAGIDIRVNMGKYKVSYNLRAFDVKVLPYENNVTVDGDYYHPHVNYSGRICWGSASDTASRASANLNFSQLMVLLTSVLHCYNPDNPYKPLEKFAAARTLQEVEAASIYVGPEEEAPNRGGTIAPNTSSGITSQANV